MVTGGRRWLGKSIGNREAEQYPGAGISPLDQMRIGAVRHQQEATGSVDFLDKTKVLIRRHLERFS
jgi:hypothetical protein